jgi:hypothetical protein
MMCLSFLEFAFHLYLTFLLDFQKKWMQICAFLIKFVALGVFSANRDILFANCRTSWSLTFFRQFSLRWTQVTASTSSRCCLSSEIIKTSTATMLQQPVPELRSFQSLSKYSGRGGLTRRQSTITGRRQSSIRRHRQAEGLPSNEPVPLISIMPRLISPVLLSHVSGPKCIGFENIFRENRLKLELM